MAGPKLPPNQEEPAGSCRWTDPTDTSLVCNNPSLTTGLLCSKHKEASATLVKKARQAPISQRSYSIKNVVEVQNCLQDIINGVLSGAIKKDKAGPLSLFLPLAFNIAKHQEGRTANNDSHMKITVTERERSMVMQLTDEEMDAYLAGDGSVKTQMIEKLKEQGTMVETRDGNVIDIESSEIKSKDIKIDHRALVRISKNTDIPLSHKQVIDLFGESLDNPGAEKNTVGMKHFDASGFGGIFEEGGLPEGAAILKHKFIGANRVVSPTKAILEYTCKWCGLVVPNIDHCHITQAFCSKARDEE